MRYNYKQVILHPSLEKASDLQLQYIYLRFGFPIIERNTEVT